MDSAEEQAGRLSVKPGSTVVIDQSLLKHKQFAETNTGTQTP